MEKRKLDLVALDVGDPGDALFMLQNEGEEIQKYSAAPSRGGFLLVLPGGYASRKLTTVNPIEYMCCGLVDKIRNPNIQIKNLVFSAMRPAGNQRDTMFQHFSDLMRTEVPHQLEVKEVQFLLPCTQHHIQQVLPFLKPAFLQDITISAKYERFILELNSVTQMEQWLQAKTFFTENLTLVMGVKGLDHFESAICEIESSWGVEEIDHMIQVLLVKDDPSKNKVRKITGTFIQRNQYLINQYLDNHHQKADLKDNETHRIIAGNRGVSIILTHDCIRMIARDVQ